ncbi:MAG: MBL fold metallo-hydrolase [Saprospiraceae bacterium]
MIQFELKSAGFCWAAQHHAIRGAERKDIKFYATFGVIRHPKHGVILYDTGYATRFFDYTSKYPYKIYQHLTKVEIKKEEEVIHQLKADGIEPDEVKHIIISHFHADHIAGLKDFPNATFICNRESYDAIKGTSGFSAMKHGFVPAFLPDDFESRLQLIDIDKGTYIDKDLGKLVDLFDDGSILLCDLNGHAVGQMGAILNTDDGVVFLIADACWVEETYKQDKMPHFIVRLLFNSWKDFKSNVNNIRSYHKNNPETLIIPCHCEKTMRRVQ